MNTTNQEYIKSSDRNVGIDVGKDTLDIVVYEFANGVRSLIFDTILISSHKSKT